MRSMERKPISSVILAFLFIVLATMNISFSNGSSYVGCIETERQALLRFKQDLIDPSNRLASWTAGDGDCCQWSGVVCDNLTGHVLELNLRTPLPSLEDYLTPFESDPGDEAYERSKLSGKINPSLLDIKHLRSLDLSDNNFEGIQIPRFLGSMQNLRYLNLSFNAFQGMVPHQLGNLSNLQYLSIGNHWRMLLYFDDMQWLSSLSLLKHLDLRVNLSKSLDWFQVISTLPSLAVLRLSSCELHHFPPVAIANLSSLVTLDLSYNNFKGPIPNGLRNLTTLRHLDLSENHFNSSIPSWLYELRCLEKLYLEINRLQGSIGAIGNLTSIERLDLSYNAFEGGIPISMGRLCKLKSVFMAIVELKQDISEILDIFTQCVSNVLESLDLMYCQLFGQLTNRLGEFINMKTLYLSYNSISGPIPSSLGHLEHLETLDLSDNSISGPIPSSLGHLGHLEALDLTYNSISGPIPSSLGNLSSLQSLYISYNKLNGTLSEIHFANLTRLREFFASGNSLMVKVSPYWIPPFKLQRLGLASCHLGSPFPSWLRSQNDLIYLDISNSRILDTIPSYLFRFPFSFRSLNLSHNQIYGEIPNLTELTKLEMLDLSSNNLSGLLPLIPFNLYDLFLSNNSLSGSIFHSLCYEIDESKTSLHSLVLFENSLSGELPDCWMNWQNLEVLKLDNNSFSGNLPISIGTLSSLMSLHLRKNNFSGTIPISLKNCTNLRALDISENKFVGHIPTWIGERFFLLMILNLRSNKFDGLLPKAICRLISLQILDLAYNNFSGTIPRCINNLIAMTTINDYKYPKINYGSSIGYSFTKFKEEASIVTKGREVKYNTILGLVRSIDLSSNNISGMIPTEVTNLGALNTLNLSHNHLTGRIPKNIGVLRSLESIDLSANQLSGEIPQSISNLTFLSYLDLSNNSLIGKIPSSTQLQGFDASCFAGNDLCGPPVSENCTVIVTVPTLYNDNGGTEHEVNWFFVGMALGFMVGFWGVISPLLINRRWRFMYYHFLDSLWYKFGTAVRTFFL